MNLIDFLASSNYIIINKVIVKKLGIETALFLSELASEHSFYECSEKTDNGYFYSTIDNIEENTTLSNYQQNKCIKILTEKGLIDFVVKGMPAKRFFKINTREILEMLDFEGDNLVCEKLENKFSKNLKTSFQKTQKQVCEFFETNNNKYNNNNSSSSTTNAREDFFGELKKSESWKELMMMRFKLHEKELDDYIELFKLDAGCRDVRHTSLGDTKRHFNDWLRIVLKAKKDELKNNQAEKDRLEDAQNLISKLMVED